DARDTGHLVFYLFNLLFIDGVDLRPEPLSVRKQRLAELLADAPPGLHFSEHVEVPGPRFLAHACKLGLEGAVSKRLDKPYLPGGRGAWVKSKCLTREELVAAGWTDPEGSRPHLGALLLGFYTPAGELRFAGRAGTGMTETELAALHERLKPLATKNMPLA